MGTLRGDVMLSASRKYFRLHSSQKPLKWKTGWIGKRGPFFPPHTTLAQSPCVHDTKKRTKGGKVRRSVPDLFSENHSGKTRRKPKEGEVGCGMGRWQQIGFCFLGGEKAISENSLIAVLRVVSADFCLLLLPLHQLLLLPHHPSLSWCIDFKQSRV